MYPTDVLAPQYSFFLLDAIKTTHQTGLWPDSLKARLCKTDVDCLPGNSSFRHSSKVTKNMRSGCPPTSSSA
ncbi:hypothetical protein TNCV_1153431 [Trichonephila clavipes]|nr:hypothetical protein TNCV_1153431 [Trichonephila clavipes]